MRYFSYFLVLFMKGPFTKIFILGKDAPEGVLNRIFLVSINFTSYRKMLKIRGLDSKRGGMLRQVGRRATASGAEGYGKWGGRLRIAGRKAMASGAEGYGKWGGRILYGFYIHLRK